jgi:hypothetical protein
VNENEERVSVELRAYITRTMAARINAYAREGRRDRSNAIRVLLEDALNAHDAKRATPGTA